MEDSKVPFADTTARRAQLMAATERFKHSISDSVDSIKDDAAQQGRTVAFVAGAAFAVYLVANALLPKSDEYRFAEKYGEPDDVDYEEMDEDDYDYDTNDIDASSPTHTQEGRKKKAKKAQKSAAASGLIGGLITSVLTSIAREQLMGFISRLRQNNAINPTADPTQYHEEAVTQPAEYTP